VRGEVESGSRYCRHSGGHFEGSGMLSSAIKGTACLGENGAGFRVA